MDPVLLSLSPALAAPLLSPGRVGTTLEAVIRLSLTMVHFLRAEGNIFTCFLADVLVLMSLSIAAIYCNLAGIV